MPLKDHDRRIALNVLQGAERIIDFGTASGAEIAYDGMTLRIDDGDADLAGFVVTLPPHDTGPFSDRLREHRVHVRHPAHLDTIRTMDARAAAKTIVLQVKAAMAAASDPHGSDHRQRAAKGAHYALMLACKASLSKGGSEGSAMVEHPWHDSPGWESQDDVRSTLSIDLPDLMQVLVSWDAVDTDVIVQGMRHDASFEATCDPITALRLKKELALLQPRSGTE